MDSWNIYDMPINNFRPKAIIYDSLCTWIWGLLKVPYYIDLKLLIDISFDIDINYLSYKGTKPKNWSEFILMTVKLFERVTPVIQGVVIELWKRSDVLLCGITASVTAHSYTGVQLICRNNSNTDIDGVVWVGGGRVEWCLGTWLMN